MPSPARPFITANQVTFARLLPMPLLTWWIYVGLDKHSDAHMAWAIAVGTLIGSTDFVDGFLARKHGPTVLGGLLDPISDKVFIAFAYTPFADVGIVPAWACAFMFVREFFVTALRSAYEQRDLSLKTTYLAKAKTWVQMQGIGVMMLFPLIGDTPWMTGIVIAGIVLPLVAMASLWFIKRYVWRGAMWMSATFVALLFIHLRGDLRLSMFSIMVGVVVLTWVSGIDYLASGWTQLRGRGDWRRADAVRLLGAISVPLLCFAVLVRTPAPAWTILAILTAELAVGGLDNLLSHHRRALGALTWGARALGVSVLLALALLLPAYGAILAGVAAAISVGGVAIEFWRGRDYYLDARIRNAALRRDAQESA